jgi:hypothetical protein
MAECAGPRNSLDHARAGHAQDRIPFCRPALEPAFRALENYAIATRYADCWSVPRMRFWALACLLSPLPAIAAEPTPIASYKAWSVFTREIEGDRICFAATDAKDKSPKSVNHGDVFFLVATWKSGAATNQPSFMAGYNLKDAPAPVIRVGSEKWDMYVDRNEGFIEASKDEQSLVSAMRRGAEMRVAAVSGRGTATSYMFSLAGVSAALDKVAAACK